MRAQRGRSEEITWGVFGVPRRRSGRSATSTGSTSWSSAAARRTSPPGSRGAARGRSASTSRRPSSRPRGAARRRRARVPARRGERRGRPAAVGELRPRGLGVRREHLVRPAPLAARGVPPAPAGRAPLVPPQHDALDPLRARRGGAARPRRSCGRSAGSAGSSGRARSASSGSSRTASSSGSSAGPASTSSTSSSCTRPTTRATTSTTTAFSADWSRRWPAEEIWVAAKPSVTHRLVLASTSPQRRAILEQLADPVRRRRAALRRARPARRRPRRARARPRAREGALRPRGGTHRRSASTRPSISGSASTRSRATRTTRARCCASSPGARTRCSPASACSGPRVEAVEHAETLGHLPRRSTTPAIDALRRERRVGGPRRRLRDPGPRRPARRADRRRLPNVVGLPGALLLRLLERHCSATCCV